VPDRIFVAFADGSWLTTDCGSSFQADLASMVAQSGRPTLVEFRAAGEGYTHAEPCEDCGKSLVDCHCDEQHCEDCDEWHSVPVCPCKRSAAELGTWAAIGSWNEA